MDIRSRRLSGERTMDPAIALGGNAHRMVDDHSPGFRIRTGRLLFRIIFSSPPQLWTKLTSPNLHNGHIWIALSRLVKTVSIPWRTSGINVVCH